MKKNNLLYDSYIIIRKSIGYLGILLPLLLIGGGLILNSGKIERSLSSYYHNNMGDVFVLVMGAAGMLLIAYRGREKIIRGLTTLGGVLALLIVLFPTHVQGIEDPYGVFKVDPGLSGKIHMISAILFFIVLGVISFWRFTDHDPSSAEDRRKLDKWYRLLGLTILICALIYLLSVIFCGESTAIHPILIAETVGLEAVGLTWLIKGSKKPE